MKSKDHFHHSWVDFTTSSQKYNPFFILHTFLSKKKEFSIFSGQIKDERFMKFALHSQGHIIMISQNLCNFEKQSPEAVRLWKEWYLPNVIIKIMEILLYTLDYNYILYIIQPVCPEQVGCAIWQSSSSVAAQQIIFIPVSLKIIMYRFKVGQVHYVHPARRWAWSILP